MYLNFLMKVLQTTADSQGDPQVVYSLLQENLDKLDDNLASVLRDWATAKLLELESEQAQRMAAVIGGFSELMRQFSLGSRTNNLEIAITGYEVIIAVFKRDDFPRQWAGTQNNLGLAYSKRILEEPVQNLEEAIRYYQQALQVFTCEKFPERWAETTSNLGTAYQIRIIGDRAWNLEAAIQCHQEALQVLTRTRFPKGWAKAQNNLGEAYRNRILGNRGRNLTKAIKCYQAALQVFTIEILAEDWANLQINMGIAYSDLKIGELSENLAEAIKCYQAALQVRTRNAFPQDWANLQNNLGAVYSKLIPKERIQNLKMAIHCYQEALQVYTREAFPERWATTQNNLANAYAQGITGEAEDSHYVEKSIHCYQVALSVITCEAFPQYYPITQFNLGLNYKKNNQLPLAYDSFATGIKTVELLRDEIISGDEAKQKLAEEHNRLYSHMVELCREQDNITEAIEYAERSKTRNLVELILTRDLHNIFPPEVVSQLQQLRDEIATNQNKIQTGKAENKTALAQDVVQLRRQRNELQDKYLPLGSSFKFDHFQATLDDHTAIIEWYITGESFHTFIFTRHSPKPFCWSATADDRKALRDWVNAYLDNYYEQKDNWLTQLTPRLQELAKILHLDEILSHLPKDCQQLILIPHRYLHLFPLHALPVGELCLLDLFPKGVNYAPSCQLLQLAKTRKRPDFTHLFAIQNPTKDRPYVDFGVEAIRPYFQPNDYVLPGEQAIKANLIQSEQLRSAHCFHFFGHATFNFEKSALILADGHLTLGEIFALDLNQCRLVILSACETGMTDFNSISDEYIGLPSGFLFAGSPSVVSTLWEVDQLSAAVLMIEFYENLRKYKQLKEGDIAIALNLAQKRLRDLNLDEFKKRLVQYKPLIDEILSKLPKVERRKAEASITYRLSQAYPFAHPSDWAAFTATGI